MPGWCMSSANHEMPLCFGTSTSVRAINIPRSANVPARRPHLLAVHHRTRRRPRSAVVRMPARSDPASGSLNSWHQASWPVTIGRRYRAFCSSVPWATIVGPASMHPESSGRPERPGVGDRLADDAGVAAATDPAPNDSSGHVGTAQCGLAETLPPLRHGEVRIPVVSQPGLISACELDSLMCPPDVFGLRTLLGPDARSAGRRRHGAIRCALTCSCRVLTQADRPAALQEDQQDRAAQNGDHDGDGMPTDRPPRPSATGTGASGSRRRRAGDEGRARFTDDVAGSAAAPTASRSNHSGEPLRSGCMTTTAKPTYSTPTNSRHHPTAPDDHGETRPPTSHSHRGTGR